ncbi:MAG: exodeoxyribonuclease V subunit gamma, partial [Oligosphaeraceae bacterium]|nr:exodeoxyribonuclease V subunit gamma [Oligosphaeraceae bacterium]
WLAEARVHWGKDAAERESLYSRAFANYSWRQGLDRLLLGLAIDDDQDSPPLLGELLPLSQANGQENRQLLEKLGLFVDSLFALANSIPGEGLTVQEWSEKLTGILETFFLANSDSAFDYGVMANTIKQFTQNLLPSSYAGERITLPVVSSILSEALQSPQETAGFLSGKITCCSLLPMRSIPCKVIALLGMDEDAFPRQENPLGFSIIAQEGRPLDRRRQWEDRFLFLETLLSAQDYLLLYYHGQDECDQKEHSPSTVIAEMLEYIQLCTGESLADISAKIIIRHPLHAFSPQSFPGSSAQLFSPPGAAGLLRQIFSYDHGSWKVARGLLLRSQPDAATSQSDAATSQPDAATIEQNKPIPAELWPVFPASSFTGDILQLSLLELENCLIDASEFYAVRSLHLPGKDWSKAELSDWEEYQLSRLDQSALLRELSEKEIPTEADAAEYQLQYQRLLADNRLPVGEYGQLTYDELIHTGSFRDGEFKQEWQKRQKFSSSLVLDQVGTVWPEGVSEHRYCKALQDSQPEAWLTCEISGKFLARANANGVLHCSFKKETRGRQLLRFYVRHLYLAALQDQPCCSYLRNDHDRNGFCLGGLSQQKARDYLRRLLRVYILASRRPLPLFEYASLAAVTAGAPQKFADFPAAVHSSSKKYYEDYDSKYNKYVRTFWGEEFPMALTGPLAWYCYAPLMAEKIFKKLQKSSNENYCQRFFQPCNLLTFTTEGE